MMRKDDEIAGLILLYQKTQDVMMPCYLQYLIDPESLNQLILQKNKRKYIEMLDDKFEHNG